MLEFLFKGIGALARDTVELADSTYETAKEITVETAEGITNIPDLIAEGYSEGGFSNGDNQPETPTPPVATGEASAAPETPAANASGNPFPGA